MMNKYFRQLLALAIVPLGLLGVDGTWMERSPMPEARFGHAIATIDSFIYISGGRSSSTGMHATQGQLWAYNIIMDSWVTDLPSLPEPRNDHVMISIGDTLWVFGGRNQSTIVTPVLFWQVGSTQWQYATEFSDPRVGMKAFVRNGMVYLIGGKTSHSMWAPPTARVDRFDPQTLVWTTVDFLNQARTNFAAATHDDIVICFGGQFVDPIASVEQGTLGSEWQFVTPLPIPRSNGNALYYQNNFVLIGGITPSGQADNNLVFAGNNWSDFESNLIPRYDLASISVESGIFVFGGRNGNQSLSSIEYFMPTVGVKEPYSLPEATALMSAYPNPFNGSVVIELSVPDVQVMSTSLTIYNMKGREVFRQQLPVGGEINHTEMVSGSRLGTSGVYVAIFNYTLPSGQKEQISQKLILLK